MIHTKTARTALSTLASLAALHTVGCGAAAHLSAATPAPEKAPATDAAMQSASAMATPEAPPVSGGVPAPAAPPSGSAPTSASRAEVATDPELSRAKEMVDIEAHLRVEVPRVADAARELRKITAASGGRVQNESISANVAENETAEFTMRVPVGKADGVFAALDGLGVTRARSVTAKDVGREYYDSVLRLRNLGVTRERLEDVLKHATEVKDILTVEGELSRVRGEMEQIEGQLRYLRDRAAFATIYVSLFVRPAERPVETVIVTPEAKFFPGVRAGYLLDVNGAGGTKSYYGGGFVLGFSRAFDLRLDGYRRFENPSGTLDAFAATLGGRFHSEYLGGGARKFLDPYLGLRGGYSRFESRNEIVAGATLGIEIWKTETVRLDLGVDALVLFGTSAGAHGTIGPSLGFDVAF